MGWVGIVLCTLMLGGCSIAAKIDARTEYQKSVADYRACLETPILGSQKLVTANAWPWKLRSVPTTICLSGPQPM